MFGSHDLYAVLRAHGLRNMILDSSMVEHSAVNRRVVGSSPTRGVESAVRENVRLFLRGVSSKAGLLGKRGPKPRGVGHFETSAECPMPDDKFGTASRLHSRKARRRGSSSGNLQTAVQPHKSGEHGAAIEKSICSRIISSGAAALLLKTLSVTVPFRVKLPLLCQKAYP